MAIFLHFVSSCFFSAMHSGNAIFGFIWSVMNLFGRADLIGNQLTTNFFRQSWFSAEW